MMKSEYRWTRINWGRKQKRLAEVMRSQVTVENVDINSPTKRGWCLFSHCRLKHRHHCSMSSRVRPSSLTAMQCLCTTTSLSGNSHHQLAFLTPGILPSRAFILNGNYTYTEWPWCKLSARSCAHPRHSEVLKHTPRFAPLNTSVVDLRRPGITVHLR